jgi:hypothetical protein
MTEAEWLACPYSMLMLRCDQVKIDGRKLRLFACACCRRVWHLLQMEVARRIVGLVEAVADGEGSEAELLETLGSSEFAASHARYSGDTEAGPHLSVRAFEAIQAAQTLALTPFDRLSVDCIAEATSLDPAKDFYYDPRRHNGGAGVMPDLVEAAEQAVYLRDIFGNPFRRVALDPAWLTPTVTALAHGIYTDRRFDALPVLADALEDAGCTNEDILAHCRNGGEHARGCWAVDLILAKE